MIGKRLIEDAGEWAMGAAPRILERSSRVVASTGGSGRRLGGFAGKHYKGIIAGAAIAGAVSAHPFREPMAAFQEEMFGDPQAFRTVAKGAMVANIEGAFRTPQQQRVIDGLHQYPDAPEYYDTSGSRQSVNSTVNGNLIFGLYNRRLGG